MLKLFAVPSEKFCSRCGKVKSADQFGARTTPSGSQTLKSYCHPCQKDYQTERRRKGLKRPSWNAEKFREDRAKNPDRYRAAAFRREYGIGISEYDRMVVAQGGVCAICGSPPKNVGHGSRRLVVDHNHETGEVRGLLCGTCNSAIGLLGDDSEVIRAAARYVERRESLVPLTAVV
jgi:hypothetical protein